MEEDIRKQLQSHRKVMEEIERKLPPTISSIAVLISDALKMGNKILIMGNGGSAADAQHMAAEIVGRFRLERPALPAISLAADTSVITALGNDYGFETVFRRQVEALSVEGDVVIGISTSGSSPNVRAALKKAADMGCRTVGILGKDGGTIKECVDIPLIVPGEDTPRIQEGHITVIHIICDLVEKSLFAGAGA